MCTVWGLRKVTRSSTQGGRVPTTSWNGRPAADCSSVSLRFSTMLLSSTQLVLRAGSLQTAPSHPESCHGTRTDSRCTTFPVIPPLQPQVDLVRRYDPTVGLRQLGCP